MLGRELVRLYCRMVGIGERAHRRAATEGLPLIRRDLHQDVVVGLPRLVVEVFSEAPVAVVPEEDVALGLFTVSHVRRSLVERLAGVCPRMSHMLWARLTGLLAGA